jgi:hypothetical protein
MKASDGAHLLRRGLDIHARAFGAAQAVRRMLITLPQGAAPRVLVPRTKAQSSSAQTARRVGFVPTLRSADDTAVAGGIWGVDRPGLYCVNIPDIGNLPAADSTMTIDHP